MKRQISEYITQLGENFENVMDTYFEEFKKRMKRRMRILEEFFTSYYNDICFHIDRDNIFVQVVKPRKACLQGFDYEIDSDLCWNYNRKGKLLMVGGMRGVN